MINAKLSRLIIAVLYVLFSLILTLYFAVAGSVGAFVISQHIMEKIGLSFREINNNTFFIINIFLSSLFGTIPFGLVAIKCISDWMKKWKVPTISDAFK